MIFGGWNEVFPLIGCKGQRYTTISVQDFVADKGRVLSVISTRIFP